MKITIHHFHEADPDTRGALARIEGMLIQVLRKEQHMADIFADLKAKVQDLDNAADAQSAVLADVKSKLDSAIANAGLTESQKADLQAISDGLGAEKDKIVAATLANTPAAADVPPPADTGTGDQPSQ